MAVLVRRRRRGPREEHANAEASDVGATHAADLAPHYDNCNDGAVALTQTITTTRRCCIVVVTVAPLMSAAQWTQIQRGGVDRTRETTISAADFSHAGMRAHVQYSAEVLDPGTYIYNLVNSSGALFALYGAIMKIVAVS